MQRIFAGRRLAPILDHHGTAHQPKHSNDNDNDNDTRVRPPPFTPQHGISQGGNVLQCIGDFRLRYA